MTLGSLFDGIGGFPYAAMLNGIETLWASEIESAPISMTKRHFPDMKHLGDITKINGRDIDPVDIITFGSPCFPCGTMVLTAKGYIEIENIKIGDTVLTHKGRWRKVTAIGNKQAETYILKGNYHGLETTKEHPIYSADIKKTYRRKEAKSIQKNLINTGEWTNAENMQGKQWATPVIVDKIPIPKPIRTSKKQKVFPKIDENLFYFVGRWLGDGWVQNGQREGRPLRENKGQIFICGAKKEKLELISLASKVSKNYRLSFERTACRVCITSQVFCEWLVRNFGKGAINKKIPSWVFTLKKEYRYALLKGIEDSDGNRKKNKLRITSISKGLILGIRTLAETLDYTTSTYYYKTPKTKIIENRIVNQHDFYSIAIVESDRKTGLRNGKHKWYKCRSVKKTGIIKTVYNISVEEDESYIADSIVVHNCQDLSIAGKRAGLEGKRSGLFMEAMRIIKEMREKTDGRCPARIIWENVDGAFSSNEGEDFRIVLEEIANITGGGAVSIPRPPTKDGNIVWESAGAIVGDEFSLAWRTLDAQYWGVPQRRCRIFLVADFGGTSAGEILFKPESLSGNSAEGGEKGEGIAGSAEKGVKAAGFNGWRSITGSLEYEEERAPCLQATMSPNVVGVDGHNQNLTGDKVNTLRGGRVDKDNIGLVILNDQGGSVINVEKGDISPTLKSQSKGHEPLVFKPDNKKQYAVDFGRVADRIQMNADKAVTLQGEGGGGGAKTGLYCLPSFSLDCRNDIARKEISAPLQAKPNGGQSLNFINPICMAAKQQSLNIVEDKSPSIMANDYKEPNCVFCPDENGKGVNGNNDKKSVATFTNKSFGEYKEDNIGKSLLESVDITSGDLITVNYSVRRLTPLECERLQGLPDGWTEYGIMPEKYRASLERGKKRTGLPEGTLLQKISDSARYKALGNGMSHPCVDFIMRRIKETA